MRTIFESDFPIEKTEKISNLILGGGLMGASLWYYLTSRNLECMVVSNDLEDSGSLPCGGLIKPSRFTELETNEFKTVLDILNSLYELYPVKLILKPSLKRIKVSTYGLNMDKIYDCPKKIGEIRELDFKNKFVLVRIKESVWKILYDKVFICTGAGTVDLLPEFSKKIGLTIKRGFSFHFKGRVEEEFVKFWAPYKQITVHNCHFNHENIVWTGDGSALTLPSWKESRIKESWERIIPELPNDLEYLRTVRGLRCFTTHKKYKPCVCEQIKEDVWVLTGAGKMGLISAGWSLNKIKEHYGF
jgi:hypothetical protein